LDLTNTFNKVPGHIINTEIAAAFKYTNDEHAEKEIRKLIPSTIAHPPQ
jgi:hypothetical protein